MWSTILVSRLFLLYSLYETLYVKFTSIEFWLFVYIYILWLEQYKTIQTCMYRVTVYILGLIIRFSESNTLTTWLQFFQPKKIHDISDIINDDFTNLFYILFITGWDLFFSIFIKERKGIPSLMTHGLSSTSNVGHVM